MKAQVPIGGRGKAGGIAVVDTPEEAQREAARILAMDIRGYPVRSVWCETGLSIDAELYLGITLDRDRRRLVIIFSAAGGMEIEQVAEETPERIAKLWPDPFAGPQFIQRFAGELAVAGKLGDPEIIGAVVGTVGEAFFHQSVNEVRHFLNVVGGPHEDGLLDVQSGGVFKEGALILEGVVLYA